MPPISTKFVVQFLNQRLSRLPTIINQLRSQTTTNNSSHGKFYNFNTIKKPIALLTGLTIGTVSLVTYKSVNAKVPKIDESTIDGEYIDKSKTKSKRLKYNFIAEVVEQTAPAVVYIEVTIQNPFSFGIAGVSGGSGFVIQPDGLIVTNAHVVANASSCTVTFTDGSKVPGIVEAIDERADLATLRVKPFNKMPFIKLADSDDARPGEFVIALGSPLSLTNSITSGIISSVGRDLRTVGLNSSIQYIQSDVAINQGNSGGPLVNLDGEAVGINSMKAGEGIAFAIPSNVAKQFLIQVEKAKSRIAKNQTSGWFGTGQKAGPVTPSVPPVSNRRYLGVTLLTLNPEITNELRRHHHNFPEVGYGAAIMKVVEGSPAGRAGLKPLDVIVALNGQRLSDTNTLYECLESKESTIILDVKRNNQDIKITVNLD